MYIEEATATTLLKAEFPPEQLKEWDALADTATGNGYYVARASRRIDQLAFSEEHETSYSPRYINGLEVNGYDSDGNPTTDSTKKIPPALAVQVALLALWYFQNPHGFYNQSPAGEESLCKQLSDLPLSIQTGLWAFISDEVKIDSDELPEVNLDRSQAGSLYDDVSGAALPAQGGGGGGGSVDTAQVNALIAAYLAANPPAKRTDAEINGLVAAYLAANPPAKLNINGTLDLGGATFQYDDGDKTLYLVVAGSRVGAIEVFDTA